jgi:hypothetical protein
LTGRNPRLIVDNNLNGSCAIVDEHVGHKAMIEQMINKMHLVVNIHKVLLENVEQVQKKQQKVFATQKGLQLFEGFEEEDTKIKIRKLNKKISLMGSWERPYDFVSYKDGKGCQE